jgi:hypothetical protein
MTIYQSRSFAQKVKKMLKEEKEILDQEVRRIAQNPSIGDEKKGDLTGVFVHKFKIKTTQYLLAYRKVGQDLELVMIGPHEQVKLRRGLPFPVEIPNEETLVVFHESEEGKGLVKCKDADDMFKRLGVSQ